MVTTSASLFLRTDQRPHARRLRSSDLEATGREQRANSEMEERAGRTAGLEEAMADEDTVREPVVKRAKVQQQEGGNVRDFPTKLPMEYKFRGTKYYVRDCYPEYYELVMDLFKNEGIEGVTITGTPGIGKSVFMGYFFQRYSKEYSDAIVLSASYSRKSVLREVALAEGGKVVDQERAESARMEKMMSKHLNHTGEHNVWLLDGPPTTIPVAARWVSFTSPNESWEKELAKEWRASIVYMPVWKLDELRYAAGKLGRNELLEPIDNDQLADLDLHPAKCIPRDAVIDVRFQVFGGVARVCFGDQRFVRRSFDKLFQAINALTMHELAGAMTSSDFSENVHRVIHFAPLTYEEATVKIGSSEIERRFKARLQITKEMRNPLESVVRGLPEASAILDFILETRTYQLLRSGCTLDATELGDKGSRSLKIEVPKMTEYPHITNTFEISGTFDRTKLQVMTPASKNLESIDGLVWIPGDDKQPNSVVLLQITVAREHPVKAVEYLEVLKALGLWEAVQRSPSTAAALVFVVPRFNTHTCTAQPIVSSSTVRPDSYVGAIHGIGKKTAATLAGARIRTVRQLGNFVLQGAKLPKETLNVIKMAKEALERQDAAGDAVDDASLDVLERIPQYVWEI